MPNNPDLIPTLVDLSLQQLIVATANIPSTIDIPTFTNWMGVFFWILKQKFLVKSSKIFL